mmetsp:Transcript_120752/g.375978  ORF Transcript_120752/g.375978 Transcript_120752/m.375978 type:complete len:257 (+) Transcript_120752:55-825(+)|eukprot:CAMPEP_0204563696 /NCGR_PEP_ID=MMETSP0661-20131031/34474_1 /ASSEMBLY_ACC=CAM_ASM_000606 /TAXON_ID=109239 /ORGANISM="Alexandrium margalefi, Strain AMGDE01CS-322" /LENGTH=256 /DNA_ID=CAMNT_0051571285 /DNA_START=55 /DNA_END=825 /DNA_ORIENTATION=+
MGPGRFMARARRRATLASLWLLGAHGLRTSKTRDGPVPGSPGGNAPLKEGGWRAYDLSGIMHKSVADVIDHIVDQSESHRGEVPPVIDGYPPMYPDEDFVGWEILSVEPGNEVDFFFDHGCKGHHMIGECRFKMADVKNPPGIKIKLAEPMDDTSQLDIYWRVSVPGDPLKNYKMEFKALCPLCGGTCPVKTPLGPYSIVEMPDCPGPADVLELIGPESDMHFIPDFMRANATGYLKIWHHNHTRLLVHVEVKMFI